MKKELSADILEKYFKGECNDEEIARVNAWYDSFENDGDDISVLPKGQQEMYRRLMLDNIRTNIKNAESDNVVDIQTKKPRYFRTIMYLAAGIAAALFVVFFVRYKKGGALPAESNEQMVVNNQTGAIHKIVLADGSKVWLSPKTTLTYPRIFAANSRQVAMTGEAFFEVTKDKARPFSIHSGNVVTKVWGTSFRIRSFKNDITKVDVITGKVSVSSDNGHEVMLLPNQEATYDKQQHALKKNTEIKDPLIGIWKKTSVSFDNTPMLEVFKILNKKFNVHIWSDDRKINSDYLKADFTDESFPAIIEMMEKTLNVRYTVNGDEFILESNNK